MIVGKLLRQKCDTRKRVDVCEKEVAKAFPYYLLSFWVVVELQYFMCQLVACDSNIKRKKWKGKVVHYDVFVLLSSFLLLSITRLNFSVVLLLKDSFKGKCRYCLFFIKRFSQVNILLNFIFFNFSSCVFVQLTILINYSFILESSNSTCFA